MGSMGSLRINLTRLMDYTGLKCCAMAIIFNFGQQSVVSMIALNVLIVYEYNEKVTTQLTYTDDPF